MCRRPPHALTFAHLLRNTPTWLHLAVAGAAQGLNLSIFRSLRMRRRFASSGENRLSHGMAPQKLHHWICGVMEEALRGCAQLTPSSQHDWMRKPHQSIITALQIGGLGCVTYYGLAAVLESK